MAPTEILAEQHYALMRSIFGDEALLMRGRMKKSERDAALKAIATGCAKAVVGTHALLEEDVAFCKLGLVVADEQHRFGVKQRAAIFSKGERPDMLIMSATPIPRTLAMLLFSELDFSVLDELPPGRNRSRRIWCPIISALTCTATSGSRVRGASGVRRVPGDRSGRNAGAKERAAGSQGTDRAVA